MSERHASANGFTLIEVLVALIVLALGVGLLAQIVQSGLRQSARSEATSIATQLARSVLARVGHEIPLRAGRQEGAASGYHWTTLITPTETEAGPTEGEAGALRVAVYSVVVTVDWGAPQQEQAVQLTTVRLGAGP